MSRARRFSESKANARHAGSATSCDGGAFYIYTLGLVSKSARVNIYVYIRVHIIKGCRASELDCATLARSFLCPPFPGGFFILSLDRVCLLRLFPRETPSATAFPADRKSVTDLRKPCGSQYRGKDDKPERVSFQWVSCRDESRARARSSSPPHWQNEPAALSCVCVYERVDSWTASAMQTSGCARSLLLAIPRDSP